MNSLSRISQKNNFKDYIGSLLSLLKRLLGRPIKLNPTSPSIEVAGSAWSLISRDWIGAVRHDFHCSSECDPTLAQADFFPFILPRARLLAFAILSLKASTFGRIDTLTTA